MTRKGNVIKVKQFRSSSGTSKYVFSLFLNTGSDDMKRSYVTVTLCSPSNSGAVNTA